MKTRNPMKQRNRHIEQMRKASTPISYTSAAINDPAVKLEKRESLLDKRIVEGYGCIWGSRNSHGEKFVKGCFAKSITENGPGSNSAYEIKFRDQHDKACALFEEIIEDEIGLYFRTKPLDNVSWANDLLVQLRSGTINNFSNGFRFIWDKVEWEDETDSLIVLEARLFEISAVTIPSDMETFAIRSVDELEYLVEDTEDFILSLPKSKQLEARKIITRNISLATQTEPPKPASTKALKKPSKPKKANIDFDYLLKNL